LALEKSAFQNKNLDLKWNRSRRLGDIEWLAIAVSLFIVHAAFFRKLMFTGWCCDGAGYQEIARHITSHGMFSSEAFNDMRTYGYPLVLSLLGLVERVTSIPLTLLSTEFQAGIYLLAAWLLRNEIQRIDLRLGRWVFVVLCLNVFVLTYAAETLTESPTLSIILLLASCWLWSVRRFRSRRWALTALAGGVLAGFSVMVRPANLFLPVAWIAGQATLMMFRRVGPRPGERVRRVAVFVLTLTAIAAPSVPQLYNNIVFGHKATPLVAFDQGRDTIAWGVRHLKFVTGLPPVSNVDVPYINPYAIHTNSSSPLSWYRDNPAAGIKTIFWHSFALIDQDFIYPYVVDLSPSYRIPLALINHIGIGLAVYALWLWLKAARRPGKGRPILRINAPFTACYILGVFAVYCTVRVDARYGLPLILLAGALAVPAVRHLKQLPVRRLIVPAVAVAVYTTAAIAASGWMRSLAPLISGVPSRPALESFAVMKSPSPGTALPGSKVTFEWSAPADADHYWLDVGTTAGKGEIFASATKNTSQTVMGIPCDGRPIYVQLYTGLLGHWIFHRLYTYTAPTGCTAK
jgi:hypothetical protein